MKSIAQTVHAFLVARRAFWSPRRIAVMIVRAATLAVVFGPWSVFAESLAEKAAAVPPALGDVGDPAYVAQVIYSAIMTKNWGLVASLTVMLIVLGLRKWVPESTSVGKALRTKLGGIATNFAFSLGGALATMYLSHHALTAALVLQAVGVALGAAGGWSILKNVQEAVVEARAAQQAEADAKAAVIAGQASAKAPDDTLNK